MEIVSTKGKLPWCAIWHIKRSLSCIDPDHLKGLTSIQIWDTLPELTEQSPKALKKARREGLPVYGLYKARSRHVAAQIILLTNEIYRGIPRLYWWTPAMTIQITR